MFVGYAYGVWGQRLGSSFKGKSFTYVYTYIRLEKNLVKKKYIGPFKKKEKAQKIYVLKSEKKKLQL